MMLSNNKKLA